MTEQKLDLNPQNGAQSRLGGHLQPPSSSRLSASPNKVGLSPVNDPYQLGAGPNTVQKQNQREEEQNKSSLPEVNLPRNLSTIDLNRGSIFQP